MGKNTGQREIRPVWNNVQRINHQNKFVPSAVLTRSGKVQVSTAKKSSLRATTSTSTFRPVNTATHTNRVNVSKLKTNAFHKSHSPIRRSFYKSTTPNTRISNEKVNTVRVNGVNTAGQTAVSAVKGNGVTAVKASAVDVQDMDGGFVAFGGSARGGKITGKGKIRTDKLDFEDVFFVNELKFNLFSISQMCDKKNNVLFTEIECLVLSSDFKLLDESQVLLRVPRQNNMYNFDLKNVVPSGDLTCLFAKATNNESKLWHRRLGHVNIKTMNKLVKGNLKGNQHKASCKAKLMSSISQPLHMLHMDLFGPTSVRSINHKAYCLVVTDDFSRCDNGREFKNREINEFCGLKGIKREFSVARTPQQNGVAERKNKTLIKAARTMLAYSLLPTVFWAEAVNTACYGNPQQDLKDKGVIDSGCSRHMTGNKCYLTDYEEIDGGFVAFRGNSKRGKITGKDFKLTDESQVLLKVSRKDNMYNVDLRNGNIREFSLARTPQQNEVAKRKNRTLIEAARTMLADSKLSTTFWAKVVNTACYVQNRVLVIKLHNKTPYELFLDALTKSMNYKPVVVGNQSNGNASTKACDDASKARVETVPEQDYILLPLCTQDPSFFFSPKSSPDVGFKPLGEEENKDTKDLGNESEVPSTKEPRVDQEKENNDNSNNNINTVSSNINATSIKNNIADNNEASPFDVPDDLNMLDLEDISIFSDAKDDDVEADMTNLDIHIPVSPIPITRIHKDHPVA
ncbi:putative ribonuclease H-like domain-containing protein [Tanacetum coccineum]